MVLEKLHREEGQLSEFLIRGRGRHLVHDAIS